MSRSRKIAGWVVSGLLAALFLASAGFKFSGSPEAVEGFEAYGLGEMRLVIAAGETASALLYLVPFTASLGVLLLSAYMGGAIVTHMSHSEPYVFQSIILIVIWFGYWLRYPEMLVSFAGKRSVEVDEA